MTIKLLDDNLINKIAAGEVIERPASIVKELVENSIDAGADKINVSIVGGGIDRIEVEDNGRGIAPEELPLAFLRHATSKIREEQDLLKILTMGFRGEALPSIASVTRIELYSKTDAQDGMHTVLEAGEIIENTVSPAAPGTKIIIKDLFYNTPARRKFLKTPVTEGSHVNDLICRYAIARPDIAFSFSNEKKKYFKTPGNGELRDAISAIYGSAFSENLLEVQYTGETYRLQGLISTPEIKRVNRKNQLFFINSRPIKSPVLYRAVDMAYKGMLLSREYPVIILSIDLDPELVDVNVHPQKSEVRFREEQAVFKVVKDVIKNALSSRDYGFNPGIINRLETAAVEEKTVENQYRPENLSQPALDDINTGFVPVGMPDNIRNNMESPNGDLAVNQYFDDAERGFKIIGQVLNTYIIVEKDESLWIADQHAAHERIIFSRLKAQYARSSDPAQVLGFPVTLELSGRQMDLVITNTDFFKKLGFDIQAIGHSSIALRSAPIIAMGQEKEVIFEILDKLENRDIPDIASQALAVMSCKKAVKAGMKLSQQEMAQIIHDLFASEDYKHCPHGRPTIIRLSGEELERMFKRI